MEVGSFSSREELEVTVDAIIIESDVLVHQALSKILDEVRRKNARCSPPDAPTTSA